MDWYLKVLKNYVGFRGRARRKEYWMFILVNIGNDSNLLIVFYVQIMPDDLVMQLHRF
ncbi:DUF805 domain-containing protein [Escherichia coli]|uniref:DUF805 domain-containing protein n=1 Tax=Escherichia coli TaxID=562 RepID=UPI003D9A4373